MKTTQYEINGRTFTCDNETIDPNKITYFVLPNTNRQLNVIGKPTEQMCSCRKHKTYVYNLEEDMAAYYCDYHSKEGGKWFFYNRSC